MKIYNHDILTCTHEQVLGNYLYGGRALGLTEPEDIIQLHPTLEAEWPYIAAHYQQATLSHSHHPLWNVDLKVLTQYPSQDVSVFYFGDTVNPASHQADIFQHIDVQWADIVAYINSKNRFIQLAHQLNIPVPTTLCFGDKAEWSQNKTDVPLPCYLKPAVSVDGVGIIRCDTIQALEESLQGMAAAMPFQIQAELVTNTFLNLQYNATGQGCERVAVSEQILADCAHQGNRYPSAHQPWDLVEPMAQWLCKQGIKGIFAFDVAVCGQEKQPSYLALECNPRYNGASYPTGIAQKLNIPCWAAETFFTQHRSLQALNLSDITFTPASGVGIVVVNWGTILVGKLVVLLAGTIAQQNELHTLLKQRL